MDDSDGQLGSPQPAVTRRGRVLALSGLPRAAARRRTARCRTTRRHASGAPVRAAGHRHTTPGRGTARARAATGASAGCRPPRRDRQATPGSVRHTVVVEPGLMSSQPCAPWGPVRTMCTTVRSAGTRSGSVCWCRRQSRDSPSSSSSRGIAERPLRRPMPHRPDDRRQPLPRGRQLVAHGPAWPGRVPHHQAAALQGAQPLREQRPAHPRHTAVDLVEPGRAGAQLADHQRRPPVPQHLDRRRDRAVVGISTHAAIVAAFLSAGSSCPRPAFPGRVRGRCAR